MKYLIDHLMRGFMVLRDISYNNYRGVDRNAFYNEIYLHLMERHDFTDGKVWKCYPPGWRRDSIKIYEENLTDDSENAFLISNVEAAKEIQRIIEPHTGATDLLACQVFDLKSEEIPHEWVGVDFIGFDIAGYEGTYSPIKEGLIVPPHNPQLLNEYQRYLNGNGLFSSQQIILKYLSSFNQIVAIPGWDYLIYWLGTVE